jgi:hypothetical protein
MPERIGFLVVELRPRGKQPLTSDNGHTNSGYTQRTLQDFLHNRFLLALARPIMDGFRLGPHHWHRIRAALDFTIMDGFLDEQLQW